MFKAAFPWALTKEEEAERAHHKKFTTAGDEEVAGSVWLAPEEGNMPSLAARLSTSDHLYLSDSSL